MKMVMLILKEYYQTKEHLLLTFMILMNQKEYKMNLQILEKEVNKLKNLIVILKQKLMIVKKKLGLSKKLLSVIIKEVLGMLLKPLKLMLMEKKSTVLGNVLYIQQEEQKILLNLFTVLKALMGLLLVLVMLVNIQILEKKI